MKRTINIQKDKQIQPETKHKKSRSIKDRPETSVELVSAIENARLDGRTTHAKTLANTRKALAERPIECALSLVRDQIAVNSTISAAIIQEMAAPGFRMLDENGNLHPLLTKHLPDVQKSILSGAATLLKLEEALAPQNRKTPSRGKGKAFAEADKPVDVSALVLELTNNQSEE